MAGDTATIVRVGELWVEVTENLELASHTGFAEDELARSKGEAATTLLETLKEAFAVVEKAILSIRKPDELEVEFGVSFGGEGGLPFVAKASADASLKIRGKWSLNESEANTA